MASDEATKLWSEMLQARAVAAPFDLATERLGAESAGLAVVPADEVSISDGEIDGVAGLWIIPDDEPDPTASMLFVHGGAFTLMSPRSHQHFVSHLVRAAAVRAFLPDYRLAPEHPYPAGLDDVSTVMRGWAGRSTGPRATVGDSAGANLALSASVRARDAGEPSARLLVLIGPWLDLTLTAESLIENEGRDAVLDARGMAFHADAYLAGASPELAEVSPVFADLRNLPPMYVQSSEFDCLRDDSMALAAAARRWRAPFELEIAAEMPHCYQFFAGIIPEADAAISRIAHQIVRHVR